MKDCILSAEDKSEVAVREGLQDQSPQRGEKCLKTGAVEERYGMTAMEEIIEEESVNNGTMT